MNEEVTMLHSTHRNKNRHLHFLLLLIPSIVFVSVLAFFLRGKYSPVNSSKIYATPVPQYTVKINEAEISVKLATTEEEQRQGLSGVQSLGENEGMLFVFSNKVHTPFWMKDMLIPLDMIWILDGKIIQIDKNVPPPQAGANDYDLKIYIPVGSAENREGFYDRVLEVNSGFSDKNNIKVGDLVDMSSIN